MRGNILVYGATDKGPVRNVNDDAFCIGTHVAQSGSHSRILEAGSPEFGAYGLLCAVADGMGGYEGGALAARTVLEELTRSFYSKPRIGYSPGELQQDLRQHLENAQFALANVLDSQGLVEAGTTLAGVTLFQGGTMMVFHCGDARLLRSSGGFLRALTMDHSPLAAAVASGRLDEAGAVASPQASRVTRAMGLLGDSRVEINPDYSWAERDRFLLCSDGLHGLGKGIGLQDLREITNHLISHPEPQPAEALVVEAGERDGRDNATAIWIDLSGVESLGKGDLRVQGKY